MVRTELGEEAGAIVTLEIPYDLLSLLLLLLLNVVDYKRLQNAITRISGVEFCGRQQSATHSLSIRKHLLRLMESHPLFQRSRRYFGRKCAASKSPHPRGTSGPDHF